MTIIPNPQGQARAFFSIETQSYVFNGMRLMAGQDGQLYAHCPAREFLSRGRKIREPWYKMKDLDLLAAITSAARVEYVRLGGKL